MRVAVLEDAVQDLDRGRHFYESSDAGVGDYFVESLLSDIASLAIYGGIHRKHLEFQRLLATRFPFGI